MRRKGPKVLVMIESSRESGRLLISGIADYSKHFGPWYIHWQPVGIQELPEMLTDQTFDGVLARNIADAEIFRKRNIPVVIFALGSRFLPGALFECANDQAICELIASHFIQRGFTNFAFFGQKDTMWSANRARCFEEALRTSDFKADVFMTATSSVDELDEESRERICGWLQSLSKPVGLMAANDDIGRAVIQLCEDAGVRVPSECAIVGVDNDPVVCGLSNPPLSSVALKQHQAGYHAAAALDKMMSGQDPGVSSIVGEVSELVVRQSSDVFAVDDRAVAQALRYIHDNVHRRLLVDEVAGVSGLCRRTLERRFSENGFSSILHYLRSARADHIATLLRESHLSIERVAELCNFSEAAHVSRFFSSVRGETPSAYRKRHSGD